MKVTRTPQDYEDRMTRKAIAKQKQDNPSWYDIDCAPIGVIESIDDLQRAMIYAKDHAIDTRYIYQYITDASVIGRELRLGSWFGGASFYYYMCLSASGS